MPSPHTFLRLDGIPEFKARMAAMSGRRLLDAVADSAFVAVDPALFAARAGAPHGRGKQRPGRTRIAASIAKAIINRGHGGVVSVAVGVYRTAPHAVFVELGTKPHLMRQQARKGRKARSRPGVHPGTAPRPFLALAFRMARSRMIAIFRTELSKRLGMTTNG